MNIGSSSTFLLATVGGAIGGFPGIGVGFIMGMACSVAIGKFAADIIDHLLSTQDDREKAIEEFANSSLKNFSAVAEDLKELTSKESMEILEGYEKNIKNKMAHLTAENAVTTPFFQGVIAFKDVMAPLELKAKEISK